MIPSIPLYVFFIPYALFLIIYGVLMFFNLHHLKIYAVKHIGSQLLSTFFLLGTVVILGTSAIILSRYDWATAINLNELAAPLMNQTLTNPF